MRPFSIQLGLVALLPVARSAVHRCKLLSSKGSTDVDTTGTKTQITTSITIKANPTDVATETTTAITSQTTPYGSIPETVTVTATTPVATPGTPIKSTSDITTIESTPTGPAETWTASSTLETNILATTTDASISSTTFETTTTDTTTETTSSSTTSSTNPPAPTPFKINVVSPTSSVLNNQLLQWLRDYVSVAPSFSGWSAEPYTLETGTNYLKAGDLYIVWYDAEGSYRLFTLDENFVNVPEYRKIVCSEVDATGTLSCHVGEKPLINYFYAYTNEADTVFVYMGTTPQGGTRDGTVSLTLQMIPI